jgi:ribonucleoside-diphosphate reductase alpha chain
MTRTMIYLADDVESTAKRMLSDEELAGLGLDEGKIRQTLGSFRGDEIAASVFLKKYALRNADGCISELTLDEAKNRWARAIAQGEELFPGEHRPASYFQELYSHFLPAGRQMFALGNEVVSNITYTNCYVTKITDDSIEGIYGAAQRLARTYSYGGGIGLCVGELRPRGAKVSNSARQSTGAVSFMDLFSLTTGLIGQAGRRGALMITIPVSHPDLEEFIEVKHGNVDKVKYANISVKLTDEFMRAVVADGMFEQSYTTSHETIRRKVPARSLWQKIIRSARDSAEPGLLFWDVAQALSPSECYPRLRIHSCNPCAEQLLSAGDACLLGSILLHTFVVDPFTPQARFDLDLFRQMVGRAVRHLDNVVELNLGRHALAEQEEAARLGRRIGLGVTGLADMLAALGIRYDSGKALEMVDLIMSAKMDAEYRASIDLARVRGSFPLFEADKHYEQGFCAALPDGIKDAGRRHGQRNVAISTVAPSGSLSIIAQCSSGIEPIFALQYKRYVELGDAKRKEFMISHPGFARLMDSGNPSVPGHWVTAHEIDYRFRISMQGIIQKYTDASISSTINLPRDVSLETVGEIYMEAWKTGLKGITVYCEGSREGILVTNGFAQQAGTQMDTIIYEARAEAGDKFYIPISYTKGDIRKPHQVFLINYKTGENDRFVKLGNDLVRMLREKGVDERRIQKYLARSTTQLSKLTRFLSLSMKTGFFDEAVGILCQHGTVGTLAAELYKILSRSLAMKNAICRNANCGSSNVRMEEGCMHCLDCGWSGCS